MSNAAHALALHGQVKVDVSHLTTEDDAPVDNFPSEKQQRLLTEPLYTSWSGPPPLPEALPEALPLGIDPNGDG